MPTQANRRSGRFRPGHLGPPTLGITPVLRRNTILWPVLAVPFASGCLFQEHPDWAGLGDESESDSAADSADSESSSGSTHSTDTGTGTGSSDTDSGESDTAPDTGEDTDGTESDTGDTESDTGEPMCNAAQLWDFETCPQAWTIEKTTPDAGEPSWACGDPTTGPGAVDHPGQWATNLDGNYNNFESSALISPAIDLSGCEDQDLRLFIQHWWDFEGGVQNYDGGLMEISTDGGNEWDIVEPEVEGYFHDRPIQAGFPPVNGQFGWCSQKDAPKETWFVSELDLGPYAGNPDVRVRFVAGTDDAANRDGWYIDSVEIHQQ